MGEAVKKGDFLFAVPIHLTIYSQTPRFTPRTKLALEFFRFVASGFCSPYTRLTGHISACLAFADENWISRKCVLSYQHKNEKCFADVTRGVL